MCRTLLLVSMLCLLSSVDAQVHHEFKTNIISPLHNKVSMHYERFQPQKLSGLELEFFVDYNPARIDTTFSQSNNPIKFKQKKIGFHLDYKKYFLLSQANSFIYYGGFIGYTHRVQLDDQYFKIVSELFQIDNRNQYKNGSAPAGFLFGGKILTNKNWLFELTTRISLIDLQDLGSGGIWGFDLGAQVKAGYSIGTKGK